MSDSCWNVGTAGTTGRIQASNHGWLTLGVTANLDYLTQGPSSTDGPGDGGDASGPGDAKRGKRGTEFVIGQQIDGKYRGEEWW